jgi:antirestriction protein
MQVDITLKTTVDIDDLQNVLDSLDYHELSIDCDDVDTIYGSDTNEKIEYLQLCDKIGDTYSYYCEHHKKFFSEDEYNDNYIGTYLTKKDYAMEYIHSTIDLSELPSIIRNNINWSDIAEDLTTDLTVIDIGYHVAFYRY